MQEFIDELPTSEKIKQPSKELIEEYGDLLFSTVQMGRHLGINAEESLQSANNKFIRRYNHMQELIKEADQDMEKMNQKEMDIFWKKVKKQEHDNT